MATSLTVQPEMEKNRIEKICLIDLYVSSTVQVVIVNKYQCFSWHCKVLVLDTKIALQLLSGVLTCTQPHTHTRMYVCLV